MYPHLYKAKVAPSLVTVPKFSFLMMEGEGDPNDSAYEEAVHTLFSISYAIKMYLRSNENAKPFVVAPLECLWSALEAENRESWSWVAMIFQPPWVTKDLVALGCEQVAFQNGLPTKSVMFEEQEEGLCITKLHLGSYINEDESFSKMQTFADDHNLVRIDDVHREIYLNNPKKTADANLKTILRYRVKNI